MSIALDLFFVPLKVLFDAVLSVSTNVGGCEWPISDRAVCMDVSFRCFSNNPPNYASVADAMTFFIMLRSTCTGTFSGVVSCLGMLNFVPRNKYPYYLLRASGYDMYNSSKYIWRIIFDSSVFCYCVWM